MSELLSNSLKFLSGFRLIPTAALPITTIDLLSTPMSNDNFSFQSIYASRLELKRNGIRSTIHLDAKKEDGSLIIPPVIISFILSVMVVLSIVGNLIFTKFYFVNIIIFGSFTKII